MVVTFGSEECREIAEHAICNMDGRNVVVVVNDWIMSEPYVFFAGDVASFHDLGKSRK